MRFSDALTDPRYQDWRDEPRFVLAVRRSTALY